MKKGKSVTYQLQDLHEKELHEYSNELHNFSGTIKRLIGNSEGFKNWQEKKKQQKRQQTAKPIYSSQNQGGIKINIGG